jgi:hypothetical protein
VSFIDNWRERRNRNWWAKWDREHRWDRLGQYNAERSRGLIHADWYVAEMAEEQAAFDAEHHGHRPFPLTIEGRS